MIKFHEKYFIESIPYEQVNPSRKQSNDFRIIHDIENKLTRFQIYQETEFACKYRNPLHKTQYSEILVKYEKGFDMTTGKIKFDSYATSHPINEGTSYIPVNFQKSAGQPDGKLKLHDSKSTRLQELSLMNSTYFGNIHYDIHLDMKLEYTISRIFQENVTLRIRDTSSTMRIGKNTNPTITRTSSTKNTLRRILNTRKQIKFSRLRRKHFMVLYLYQKSITSICF